MATEQILKLKEKANWVRQRVLEMITTAGKGHIGGAFSLYGYFNRSLLRRHIAFSGGGPKMD